MARKPKPSVKPKVSPCRSLVPVADRPAGADQPASADPDDEVYEGLTLLQSRFCRAFVHRGDGRAAQAARDAGYAETTAQVHGSALLRRDDVLAIVHRLTLRRIGALAPSAITTMANLLDAKSEFVRQQAASDLLDRAGFKPVDRVAMAVGGGISIDIKLTD